MQGSALQVPAGQTLSVVGGDITLVGNSSTSPAHPGPTLGASGGRIQLVSVASPGEVGVDRVASAPDLRMEGFTRLGRIDLSQGAVLTVGSGGNRNAGEIEVRGGQLTLSGGSQFDASTQGAGREGTVTVIATEALTLTGSDSRLTSSTSSDGDAGRVFIKAPLVSLKDQADIQARAQGNDPRGNAGEIEMQVGTLALSGAANISNSNDGQGQGGKVTIVATEAITLRDQARVTSNARSSGAGGQIVIKASSLSVTEGAGIRAQTARSGNAGDIRVEVGTLTLSGGDQITNIATSTTDTTTTGRAGNVTVIATEAITLAGRRTEIASSTRGSGDGGQIVIKASSLSVTEGAGIRAQADPVGGPIASGNAGDIRVEVGTLTLSGRDNTTEIVTSTTDTRTTGRAGNVTVIATKAITLIGQQTQIASITNGSGDAGRVFVSAPMVSLKEGASIRTGSLQEIGDPAPRGNAGDIIVQGSTLTLTGGASISSSTEGAGRGGASRCKHFASDSLIPPPSRPKVPGRVTPAV
jgi:large exoprotein involved in heme utilization and adhesion